MTMYALVYSVSHESECDESWSEYMILGIEDIDLLWLGKAHKKLLKAELDRILANELEDYCEWNEATLDEVMDTVEYREGVSYISVTLDDDVGGSTTHRVSLELCSDPILTPERMRFISEAA